MSSYVDPQSWHEEATQKSVPIPLVAGQKYYIEALQKDGAGGDHLAVGWRLPTGELERPIPGARLLPFESPLKEPDTHTDISSQLDYSYYEGEWSSLPDFTSMTPVSTGTVSTFDIAPRNRDENFGLMLYGYIDVPADGEYTFYTNSDDGSKLWISANGTLVVNNDGIHGDEERSGKIGLKKGKHIITVAFFQAGWGLGLGVSFEGPSIPKQIIPASRLFRLSPPASCSGAGSITREQWDNIAGDQVSAIPVETAPSSISEITRFEATPDIADAYGSRIRGYICAPYTGNYTFWIASDDQSELWLSTNDDPANKVKIAFVSSVVAPQSWDEEATQKSVSISLVAGQKYYIEALQKDGAGGDHLAVGWQLPSGEMERPIPGYRLLPFVAPLKEPDAHTDLSSQLEYRYYEGEWSSLPDFTSMTPVSTGTVSTFDIAPRNRDDNFGLVFNGYIDIPADGEYTFYTNSDDGSKLWIGANNMLVVNNDGIHGDEERVGKIGLKKGKHIIKVAVFQAGWGFGLGVSFEGPSIPKQIIPASRLFRLSPPASCNGTGSITREQWDNVEGDQVSAIPVGAIPSSTSSITKFEATPDIADSYGSRIRGYVCAPYTGNYTFWIASDDQSELWLSTNDNPANKVKIAFVNSYVAPQSWDEEATQKSVPIPLAAGQKYYIEALQKEGIGGDHLAVGWQIPTGEFQRPIPGDRLLPFGTTVTLKAPDGTTNTSAGLDYRYYEGQWSALPSFNSITPVSTGTISTFSITPKSRNDNFGFVFRGYIDVPNDGEYTFYTNSNEGSKLWIGANNMLVVSNDGLHDLQERSGRIGLKKGKHIITVAFFEAEGQESLSVSYKGPSISKQVIPASRLFRLPASSIIAIPEMRTDEVSERTLKNYPNPFTGITTVEFSLKEKGRVSLEVLDNQGNKISSLYEGDLDAGVHSIQFNATALSTGSYICKLVTNDKTETIKLLKISRPAK